MFRVVTVIAAALLVSGCATWSHSTVAKPQERQGLPLVESGAGTRAPTNPAKILVTEDDISDRPYESLGDISVTVNKTTLFHPDPTPELVAEKLREEAAKLGADAVILVRYGTVGVSFVSWGSLDGKGRAIRYVKN